MDLSLSKPQTSPASAKMRTEVTVKENLLRTFKQWGKGIYHAMPEGALRRWTTTLAYRQIYGKALAGCTWRNGSFVVSTRDGIEVRTVRDFDPESLAGDFHGLALPANAVIMDVGSNIGAVTLYWAARVGAKGRVIAYEPDPDNLALLGRNLDLNGKPAQVTLVPQGISDHEGTVTFFAGGTYTSSCEETDNVQGAPGNYRKIEIPVTTLDAEGTRLALSRLDFVKIDIEGSEVAALRGARALLERFHPTLYIETHIVKGQRTDDAVEGLLKEYGYRRIVRKMLVDTAAIFAGFA